MTQGFRVLNSSGNVQIDDAFSNYALSESGTATVGFNTTVSFTGRGVVPLIFARWSSSSTIGIRVIRVTQSSFTVSLSSSGSGNVGTTTLEWRAYIPMSLITSPLSSHGLVIRQQNGEVAFRSDASPLNISSVINFQRSEFIFTSAMNGVARVFKNTNIAAPFVLINNVANPDFIFSGPVSGQMTAFLNFVIFRNGSDISLGLTVDYRAIPVYVNLEVLSLSLIINGFQ